MVSASLQVRKTYLGDFMPYLRGQQPPEDFEDNGCTCAPDFWFRMACRIHDYEYSLVAQALDSMGENLDREVLTRAKLLRKEADHNLWCNIILLSTHSVQGDELVSNPSVKGLFGRLASVVYFVAVRLFGWTTLIRRRLWRSGRLSE